METHQGDKDYYYCFYRLLRCFCTKNSHPNENAANSVSFDTRETTHTETRLSLTEDTKDNLFKIYICGCVRIPGVYQCNKGDRGSDIIEMDGGATQDADLTTVNLARLVADAEQINIRSVSDTSVSKSAGITSAETTS